MAEWSNAHDSKSCYVGTRTEVRILFSAPQSAEQLLLFDGLFHAQSIEDLRGGKKIN